MKRFGVMTVVALTGCFDFQGAYYERCLDAGLCGDAGAQGSDAGSDAGIDGGYDAGVDAGRPSLTCNRFDVIREDAGILSLALAA